jgi:hypothetical protein
VAKVRQLSPDLALLYVKVTDRTFKYDLDDLVEMGLVTKTEEGVRARKEIILAQLPDRKQELPDSLVVSESEQDNQPT